jgi:hypothetical protein
MYEKTNTAFSSETVSVKFPSKSDVTPLKVPFSITVTPGKGPVSSLTEPEMSAQFGALTER